MGRVKYFYSSIFIVYLLSSVSAQNPFDRGVSIFAEGGPVIRNNDGAYKLFSTRDMLGAGYGIEKIETGISLGVEFRLIDSLKISLITTNSRTGDLSFEKGNLSVGHQFFLCGINYYYLNKKSIKAMLGIQIGTGNAIFTISHNTDTINIVKGYPVIPQTNDKVETRTFTNKTRLIGIEHRIEKTIKETKSDKNKRLKFIAVGIYTRLNYAAATLQWNYHFADQLGTSSFSFKNSGSSWQFSTGFYVRWHFNKKRKTNSSTS